MNVLIVAAHPDDEALGCGGSIARHAREGDRVCVAFMTDGVGARGDVGSDAKVQRIDAAKKAAEILQIKRTVLFEFPDNRMDSVPLLDVVKELETLISQEMPRIVYTHHGSDLNVDHRIAFQAVLTACRPQPGVGVSEILCFETPSSTEWSHPAIGPSFEPNLFVDISRTLEQKLDALRSYEKEMRTFPHPRSMEALKALACQRGSSVGVDAAEAFSVVRAIR